RPEGRPEQRKDAGDNGSRAVADSPRAAREDQPVNEPPRPPRIERPATQEPKPVRSDGEAANQPRVAREPSRESAPGPLIERGTGRRLPWESAGSVATA